MKTIPLLRKIFFIECLFLHVCCFGQSAETIASAKNYYELAKQAFTNGQYDAAIENGLISISNMPTRSAYYVLTCAYAKNGNVKTALTYAGITLKAKPGLTGIYRDNILRIQQWASGELQKSAGGSGTAEGTANDDESVHLVSDAITLKAAPNFTIPAPPDEESAFSEQGNNTPDTSFRRTVIYHSGRGQFTTPVYDNYNNKVGEITSYGFTGGQTNGTALTFSLPIKGVVSMEQLNEPMARNSIVFTANELNIGAVKTRVAGILTFKATILGVDKFGADRYYMQSVKVVVNAYPTPLLRARIFR